MGGRARPTTGNHQVVTMASFEDFTERLRSFSGQVRLFPLPGAVLFPHVLQPVHIFEPRYREMFEESLATDKRIALAILLPGWERDYEGRPPIHPIACLGEVATHHRLKGGSYNVLLMGLKRVRIVRELPPSKSFREAEVELCDDLYPDEEAYKQTVLQDKLRRSLVDLVALLPEAREQLDQLTAADVPLGVLADIVSYVLEIEPDCKRDLLGELNVFRRVERLLILLDNLRRQCRREADGGFPPDFSSN